MPPKKSEISSGPSGREQREADDELLKEPKLLVDPVFPKARYLEAFGTHFFPQLLVQANKRDLVGGIRLANVNPQMLMLTAGNLTFRAFELDLQSESGASTRAEFLSLLKQSTATQQLLAKGAVRIQVENQTPAHGEYQVCKVKVIGWCVESAPPSPDDPTGWQAKGQALAALGRTDEALTAFEQAARLDPKRSGPWHDKGLLLFKSGRNEEALQCLDRAVELNPRAAETWSVRGNLLLGQKRFDEALPSFERALECNPLDARSWLMKAFVLGSLKRGSEAVPCLARAREIDPKFVQAFEKQVGFAPPSLEKYQEPRTGSEAAALACFDKGLALQRENRFEEAIAEFQRAIDLAPHCINAWFNKGVVLSQLSRDPEAIACFDQVLRFNPKDDVVWLNKAVALQKTGRWPEAIACFDRAIAFNPRNPNAWALKGALLSKNATQQSEALRCFEEAQRLGAPGVSEAIKLLRQPK